MDYIGWINPKAELIKCNEYGHLDTARKLVRAMGFATEKEPDDVLIANGWIRISMLTYRDRGYLIVLPHHITAYQHDFLDEMIDNVYEELSEQTKKMLEARNLL